MRSSRWMWVAGAAVVLVLALGWRAVDATPATRPVDWAALSPDFQGATFVNDPETCRTCHEDAMRPYESTPHARALGHSAKPAEGDCESCHGPRSKHVEDPTAGPTLALTTAQESAICMQCHEGGSRFGWKGGAHHSGDVSCTSCHTVMQKKSPEALLNRATVTETCYTCHGDVRSEMSKISHHPVREGRMSCTSCHNAHGATAQLLVRNTLNETCFTCHTDKRGPFVWEHAPVRESCANCHTQHGSNNRNLLTNKDPFLCLGCHSYGGHINLPRYNRVSSSYGNGCLNCHITTHGSNHPSGVKQTR